MGLKWVIIDKHFAESCSGSVGKELWGPSGRCQVKVCGFGLSMFLGTSLVINLKATIVPNLEYISLNPIYFIRTCSSDSLKKDRE